MSLSHNKNNTTREDGEGTLTICKCGREFYLSFEYGFQCKTCKRKVPDAFKLKLQQFIEESRDENKNKSDRHNRNS